MQSLSCKISILVEGSTEIAFKEACGGISPKSLPPEKCRASISCPRTAAACPRKKTCKGWSKRHSLAKHLPPLNHDKPPAYHLIRSLPNGQ